MAQMTQIITAVIEIFSDYTDAVQQTLSVKSKKNLQNVLIMRSQKSV